MEIGAAQLLPMALSLGGYLMNSNAQQEAADEKRNILNQQLARDEAAQKKSTQMVTDEAKNFSGDKRLNDMATNEQAISTQQNADLQAGAGGNQVGSFDTSGDAGNVSEDFIKGKAQKAVSEGNRLTSLAREIAKTRAPGVLQNNEAERRADLSSTLQNLFGSNSNMAKATENDANSVQADTGLGSLASAIGMGMMSRGKGFGWEQLPAPVSTAVPKSVSGINW